MKSIICFLFIAISLPVSFVFSEEQKTEGINLTVYNQNFAVIRDSRFINLKKGVSTLSIVDIASKIDPTSVTMRSLKNPGAIKVLEQNYQYDLVNKSRLLEKYIGKEITIGSGTGKLLSADAMGIIMEIDGKIKIFSPGTDSLEILLPKLPENLILKPTLNWIINSNIEGTELTEISYITSDISWKADYNAICDKNDTFIDLTAWVTLDNNSGASYNDATLKLIAGDVNLVMPQRYGREMMTRGLSKSMVYEDDGGFTEKSFFEYHLYDLGRPATILDKETKQIELVNAASIPIKKTYIYDGFEQAGVMNYSYQNDDPSFGKEASNKKVRVAIEFNNKKDNNLGIPLPKGKIRTYKKNDDGSFEFIGEDQIDHTPKDELVTIEIGNAFDIVGERKQTDFRQVFSGHVYDESFEIKIKNHKDDDIEVKIVEHMYRWSDWTIINTNDPYVKKDSKTIEFTLKVPKNGENSINYTVEYKW